ncbi:migration and invasion-inhibitory protein [Spea bombifrons]|uniref:migration and invasion-inhibitory protein n=1 Tax=Spea bombifrons TaxID=233779 RepID=UPI00234A20D7|nr:migration and invasion-inhibitory protein [Spea bombifrons]
MSDELEDLRRANKSLLDRLKMKREEFMKVRLGGGQSARGSVSQTDTNGALNKNGVRVGRGPTRDRDSMAPAARGSLIAPRRAVQICEAPASSQRAKDVRSPRHKRSEDEPERAVKIQTPVKRLSFRSSSALPTSDAGEMCQSPPQQYVHRLNDEGNIRTPKSILVTPRNRDSKRDNGSTTAGHQGAWASRPLLGYDWIAGVLELNSPIADRPDHFFSEIGEFRRVNRAECVQECYPGSDDGDSSGSDEGPSLSLDTHQCIYCYRVNNRLFASPVGPESACPVCKKRRSKRHLAEEPPAYVRVSIPRSTLLPPYKYKAHRRKSFDPTDSLALPSHCLAGWENSVPSGELRVTSLDLRSSTDPDVAPAPVPMDHASLDNISYYASRARSENLLNMSRSAFFQRSKAKFPGNV